MQVAVLYSGGKDSSLAAWILKLLGYNVELITANFGVVDSWKYAKKAARALGFEHKVIKFDRAIIEKGTEIILKDGYPKNGINYLHKYVIEEGMKGHKRIADGTRRDDRVPWLTMEEIKSLEDRHGGEYLTPLRGIGHKTIKELANKLFIVEEGESDGIDKGDYEAEIRALIRMKGRDPKKYFPNHKQSIVHGWKDTKAI